MNTQRRLGGAAAAVDDATRVQLGRVIACVNDKGGVLKTSIVANVAGALAAAGQRVLVIDLDPQGTLKLDLGVDPAEDDNGKSIADALLYDGFELQVVPDVRPGLDIVCGGKGIVQINNDGSPDLPARFANKLAVTADNYDLVLIDCPPELMRIYDMALAAARWVLIPTKTDSGSLDGLFAVGERTTLAQRSINPTLDYLGVVITDHSTSAVRVLEDVTERLAPVTDRAPLFATTIRHSQSTAFYCRDRGQLAVELAHDSQLAQAAVLQSLSKRKKTKATLKASRPALAQETAPVVRSAKGVAADYQALAIEICERIVAAEQGDRR